MNGLEIKTAEEWDGIEICDAVLLSIGELNRYHNLNQTSKCQIGGCCGRNLYFAKTEDIKDFLSRHPSASKIKRCLKKLERRKLITKHFTGGYLLE